MTKSNKIEILDVRRSEINSEVLWGFAIDSPKKGDKAETYIIETTGWVLGKKSKVVAVELVNEGRVLRKVPTKINRQGVAKRYPEVLGAKNSGFRIEVGTIGLPIKGEIKIRAVFENKTTLLLATVYYRRQLLYSNYQPKLQPLVFTSSGRSGTTWLMRLFSQHPSIIMSEFYPYEFRVAQYWIQMLTILSQPRNPENFDPTYFYQEFRWIGANPYHGKVNGHSANYWFGHDYPEQLADFCRQSIDNLYQHIGRSQGKIMHQIPRNKNFYFVEKFLPNPQRKIFLEVYPQAKEIFLVRDFRDICCSVLAFNTKRGYIAFGRERVDSDREYIRTKIKSTAVNMLELWRQIKERAYLVRYEDLILNPKETLSSIFEYLNLDNSSSTICEILEKTSEDTPQLKKHRTSSNPQESIGRWRQDLEPSLQALCTEVCQEALQEFGYSLTGEEKLSPLPKTIKPQVKTKPSLTPTNSNLPTSTESARQKLEQIKSQFQNIKKYLEKS